MSDTIALPIPWTGVRLRFARPRWPRKMTVRLWLTGMFLAAEIHDVLFGSVPFNRALSAVMGAVIVLTPRLTVFRSRLGGNTWPEWNHRLSGMVAYVGMLLLLPLLQATADLALMIWWIVIVWRSPPTQET